jgi:REP element-mobilizing transposase RayT
MPRRSPSLVLVHIVWATSRRRPTLSRSLDDRLLAILGGKAHELHCPMLAGGCASDHVHVVVRLASGVSLGELVRRMKGASAYELNHDRTTRPFAWQDGYWDESLGPADLNRAAHYVRHQRHQHDASHHAERWANAVDST